MEHIIENQCEITSNSKNKSIKPLNTSQVEKIMPEIFEIIERNRYTKNPLSNLFVISVKRCLYKKYLKYMKNPGKIYECCAGYTHGVLDADGNIYLCELMPSVGNIRKDNLWNVWRSDEAKRQRKVIKSGCWCQHSCFQNSNLYLDFKNYPSILIETIIILFNKMILWKTL